ncbi:MAG: hypothetical protein AAGA90_00575 [Actinomycetota bacterium]
MPSETTLDLCDRFADELAGTDDAVLSADASDHVRQCLRCQAEIANYRRMRRALRTLAETPGADAPELEHRILVALDELDGQSSTRVPAVAAATIGGLAAAAGVIAIAARRRAGLRLAS